LPDGSVVDTVVLRYFLLVEQAGLLAELLPAPRLIPTAVFDPSDAAAQRGSLSEISESVRYHQMLSADERLPVEQREAAGARAARLSAVRDLDWFETTELEGEEELAHYRGLTSRPGDYGLVLPLGAGESACIAVGIERGLAVVTDDNDALKVLKFLAPSHPYERIRRLLQRGADEGLISEPEANEIHQAITAEGFRDKTLPFPPPPRKRVGKVPAKRAAKRRRPR
jgi:predicted nucleic acid-binding protein